MVDQDLFGPANCELFEEFKILMATRANYTANASVRYTTPLFSYISIFFSFFWRQLPFLVDVFYKVALSFFLFFSLFLIAVFSLAVLTPTYHLPPSNPSSHPSYPLPSLHVPQDMWYATPLSEIDFSQCRKCTPSYRALPKSYPKPVCSERNEVEASLLNDVVSTVCVCIVHCDCILTNFLSSHPFTPFFPFSYSFSP